MDHAPHPNAAALFANWISSREGLEVYSKSRQEAPTRNDIDEARFLPAALIPKPGVSYIDTFEWNFTVTTKEKVRLWMKDLLRR